MWTIPAEREAIEGVKHSQRGSKMRTPHLVPLSRQALAILKQVQNLVAIAILFSLVITTIVNR
jgi:integrase